MRRAFAIVTILALALSAVPVAFAQQTGGVEGVAQNAANQPLANHTVQLRNTQTGQLAATGTTNAAGQFTFTSIAPGNYVVEIVNAAGQIIGTATVTVAAGAVASITVAASAVGALGAAGGGFSLFGLGTAASLGVIAGAAAITVTAVVAAQDDASPSR